MQHVRVVNKHMCLLNQNLRYFKAIRDFVVVQLLNHIRLFCDSMDCSPAGSAVRGISQARTLEQVAISSSRGSSRPRDQIQVSCTGRRLLYHCTAREAHQRLCVCVCQSLSRVRLFVIPWTIACRAPLSIGFPRQEYWSGLPFSPPHKRLQQSFNLTPTLLKRRSRFREKTCIALLSKWQN